MDRTWWVGLVVVGLVGCGDSEGGAGGSGGGTTATQGTGGEAPGEHAPHCANQACGECKATHCNAIDNPCNENPECEPAQQRWRFCVCLAAGDADGMAACDAALLAVDADAGQPIIDCVADNCPACLEIGEDPPADDCRVTHPECTVCVQDECNAQITACGADPACGPANAASGGCMCEAQKGSGSVEACLATFEADGGAPGADLAACVTTACRAACGL